jgi:hypothetical protein
LYDCFFFSAPQLKRISLGGKDSPMRGLLGLLLIGPLPLALRAQTPLALQPKRVTDSTLVEVLNWGEKRDLNKLPGGDHTDLALRLYSVGHSGSCVEETEWVCSYHYVLAVSEHGEQPSQSAFDLGELGEIGAIRWSSPSGAPHVLLELKVRNYPLHALKRNSKLKPQSRTYRLAVSVDSLTATPVP